MALVEINTFFVTTEAYAVRSNGPFKSLPSIKCRNFILSQLQGKRVSFSPFTQSQLQQQCLISLRLGRNQLALNTHLMALDAIHTSSITQEDYMHQTLQILFERFMTACARINPKISDDTTQTIKNLVPTKIATARLETLQARKIQAT